MKKKTKKLAPKRKLGKPPKNPRNVKIGQSIRTAREQKGITQLALAHAIGYTGDDAGAYISRVESGTQEPRIDTLSRIADSLGVDVCILIS